MLLSRYWTRRFTRHASIGTVSVLASVVLFAFFESPQLVWRVSMATAYTGLALIAISLLLGPLNVLLVRPNPVSFDLRRDIGIWGALLSLVHVVAGLQVHFAGRFWNYFVFPPDQRGALPVRYDLFGVTNYFGLFATGALILLLALSNDRSLARMGVARWKRLQRFNYLLFAAVIAHGLTYQYLEDRAVAWIATVCGVAIAVVALQSVGFLRIRRGLVSTEGP